MKLRNLYPNLDERAYCGLLNPNSAVDIWTSDVAHLYGGLFGYVGRGTGVTVNQNMLALDSHTPIFDDIFNDCYNFVNQN